jgi:hypothetical protein
MLENLLQTWEILAPGEINYDHSVNIFTFGEGTNYQMGASLTWIESNFYSQRCLQGYIQQCIEARDEWDWLIVSGSNSKKLKVFDATVFVDGKEFLSTYSTAHEALLSAYMTALAMQRPVTQGPWKHADGDKYQVECCCPWANRGIDRQSYAPRYKIEEQPDMEAQPYLKDYADFKWVYRANKDYGDRVFYHGNSGRWARLTDSFLGLKDDGRLRFEKIDEQRI